MVTNWQYYLLKGISTLISLLPYGMVLALGKMLGPLYGQLVPRMRRRATAQLQECLSIEKEEADRVVQRFFAKLGQTFMEVLYMPALNHSNIKKYVTIENRHYLDEALQDRKGVVLLTAHIGNWEWLGAALAMAGFPMATVVKRQPNDQHTRILNEYRQRVGIEIFARGSSELVGAAKALKQGKVLGFLADQDGGESGVVVPFLGKAASTPLGPAVFAKRFQAPVVPIFIVRRPKGGHRVLISQPFYYEDSGNENRDIYNLTMKMTAVIEDTIRSYPDEWLWFQKRWNTPVSHPDITQSEKAGEAV